MDSVVKIYARLAQPHTLLSRAEGRRIESQSQPLQKYNISFTTLRAYKDPGDRCSECVRKLRAVIALLMEYCSTIFGEWPLEITRAPALDLPRRMMSRRTKESIIRPSVFATACQHLDPSAA